MIVSQKWLKVLMRKATRERYGYEAQYYWYVFKISGNPEYWKRHIQTSVPLSSMKADGRYGARFSYARNMR
jgi:hypothetical protein